MKCSLYIRSDAADRLLEGAHAAARDPVRVLAQVLDHHPLVEANLLVLVLRVIIQQLVIITLIILLLLIIILILTLILHYHS